MTEIMIKKSMEHRPTTTKRREFLIILSVAFSSFMAGLNNYIVSVSLPSISRYFNTGTAEVSRVVLAYLLAITSLLLFFGRLGDRIGHKKVFVVGYAVFTLGSLLCGLSGNIHTLVAFRLIQGIGGAMLLANGFAIIAKYLPPGRTGSAFGVASSMVALGIATGAPLGGIISGYLSWHWIFFVNVPVGTAAIFVAGRSIPAESGGSTGQALDFDIPGAMLSFCGLALFLFAFNGGRTMGWTHPAVVVSFLMAAILLTLFIIHEGRCPSPLLDFALLSNSTFTLALCATFMSYMVLSGNAFLFPFYLELIHGLSTQQTGFVLFFYALVFVFLSPSAGKLSDRINPRLLCTLGMLSASLATFLFACFLTGRGLIGAFVFLVWFAGSYVLFISPNTNRIMSTASEGKHGAASGLLNTMLYLSMIFGVALFEAIFAHSFSGMLLQGRNLFQANVARGLLLNGFTYSYILAGVTCFLSCLCSVAARK
jgi:EmrB/QacA subfamily drug resistance transporter